jgi:hypothetical protein
MVEAVEKGAAKPSAEQLWQAGKVWMGPHGKGPAMAEIPDWLAGLGKVAPNIYAKGSGLLSSPPPGSKLGEYLEHPQLYSAYPGGTYRGGQFGPLSDIPLGHPTSRTASGSYIPELDRINLTSLAPHDMLTSVLHETQHAIAEREGFPQGTSYRTFLPGDFHAQTKAVTAAGEQLHTDLTAAGMNPHVAIAAVRMNRPDLNPATMSRLEETNLRPRIEQFLSHSKYITGLEDEAKRKYFLHPGELLPKAVEMRMNLSPAELARETPDESIREFIRALR